MRTTGRSGQLVLLLEYNFEELVSAIREAMEWGIALISTTPLNFTIQQVYHIHRKAVPRPKKKIAQCYLEVPSTRLSSTNTRDLYGLKNTTVLAIVALHEVVVKPDFKR